MDFQRLTSLLHDPDPQKRIGALRVLAMVEETRALNALVLVYKNDPDEQVRKTAKWAGSIIWEAQKRGHDTEAAIQSQYSSGRTQEMEEIIVERITRETLDPKNDDPKLKNQLDMARIRWEQIDAMPRQTDKSSTQLMDDLAANLDDDFDLLDDGLSNL